MLILASQVLFKPTIASDLKSEVGRVSEIIVDPENGKVVGFFVSKPFKKPKAVAEVDVLDLTKNGLIINSENALTEPKELIKVKEIIDRGIKILNSKAVTQSQKVFGRVEDFLIETETATLVKFYIKGGLFSPSLILPSEKVVKIERGKIIFTDDVLEKPKATEAAVA